LGRQELAHHFRREGREGLQQLAGIGEGLSGSIAELLGTGHLGHPGFYAIALRDFGLSLGALALARLSQEFEPS
jgi:hypothetical protein